MARVTPLVASLSNGEILGGPFSGMRYIGRAHSSQLGPKLLGTYEREVGQIIDSLSSLGFDRIIDVGAAEGYYAVGMLRLLPEASMIAFEADPAARSALSELAALNCVESRLDVRVRCEAQDLEQALNGAQRPLVIMDIDGGELDVLDPERAPALRRAWILVELHPHLLPNVRELLAERFAASHRARHVAAVDRQRSDLPSLGSLSSKDLLAAAWEARPDGQGWLWLEPIVERGERVRGRSGWRDI